MMLKIFYYILLFFSLFIFFSNLCFAQEKYNQARDGFGSVSFQPEQDEIISPSEQLDLKSAATSFTDASNVSEIGPDPSVALNLAKNISAESRQTFPNSLNPSAPPTVNNISIFNVIQESPPADQASEFQTSTNFPGNQNNNNQNFVPNYNYQQQSPYYPQFGQPNNQYGQYLQYNDQQQLQQPQQQFIPNNNNNQQQQFGIQQQQQQQNQMQQNQGGGCTLAGCSPPQVNERQYEANAQQYSYNNINFNQQQQPQNNQQQQFPNQQQQPMQQFNGPNQQIYGNPQTFTPNNNNNQNSQALGVYPSNYQNQGQQPLRDPQQQNNFNSGTPLGNNNNFGGGVNGPNQEFQGPPESGSGLQQITITNVGNNSSSGGLEPPTAERLTITKYPNGTVINVEKSGSSQQNQGLSNFSPVGGFDSSQSMSFNNNGQFQGGSNPSSISSSSNGGTIYGPGNPPPNQQFQNPNNQQNPNSFDNNPQNQNLNQNPNTPSPYIFTPSGDNQQEYDQSAQGYSYMAMTANQLYGIPPITTGGVIMAPDGSGVPLLVNPDYLYNNYRTGQIKVIDASYNSNQGFVDYQTFQLRQYYGNFVAMKNQFINYDYTSSHILNAVYFNIDIATYPTRNQKYTLYPPSLFQQYVQSLGINQNDYIIVYSRDNLGGMRYAAAVWELFRIYNHTRISVLNGGLNAWSSAGYDLTSDIVNPRPGNWIANFDSMKVITFEEMVAIQPNGRCYFQETGMFNFLDTRSRIEYQQNGRLFGSKNFPVNEIIQSNGMIMSRDDINIALARANYTRGQTSFVMDTNGLEAAFGVLALAVVGDTRARLYNGGIYEISQRSPYILIR